MNLIPRLPDVGDDHRGTVDRLLDRVATDHYGIANYDAAAYLAELVVSALALGMGIPTGIRNQHQLAVLVDCGLAAIEAEGDEQP